ncbi:fructose-bisphosphatase class I [Helicobacter monodelphidis]|uniref:class 1 fructose-bisphosphatase n=1 Tax=Helicobacter sp. 15-1451 TaxID=2004995 RepID=UPI000DCE4320|nr:class 1 fructose-bisphosphatase [Helicobacter sp. 15-1451]RAX57019.1 fructose-bisphosphatase class I [Helicobacter sp. 15-1451]
MQDIFQLIQSCAVEVYKLLKKSSGESSGNINSSGDSQLKFDVIADQIITQKLLSCPAVYEICSEEQENSIKGNKDGNLCIAYDPLDGSSVFESNFLVGSIFGIYEHHFEAKNLIASAYILYGFNLEIVIATQKVLHYRYDGTEFVCIGELKLNSKGKINSPGGTQKNWTLPHKTRIESLFDAGYRLRYSGAMVADLHQILKKGGGLFSYPATTDSPQGKLRLLFEVLPFAFLFEKAGGGAIDGKTRLLERQVDSLHATSACFFGSMEEIQQIQEKLKED